MLSTPGTNLAIFSFWIYTNDKCHRYYGFEILINRPNKVNRTFKYSDDEYTIYHWPLRAKLMLLAQNDMILYIDRVQVLRRIH